MAHIVHLCPRYAPARGGVELFFETVSEALVRRGHSVSVWTTDAATVRGFTTPDGARLPGGPETIGGVTVRRFPVRYVPWQRYVRTAAHWLPFGRRWKCDTLRWTPWVPSMTRHATAPSEKVDLVHAAGLPYSSLLYAGWRLARSAGAPLVMSPFTHVPPPGRSTLMRRAYLSPLNIDLLSKADRVFVQTEFERQTLSDAGIETTHQRVVGLGVDAISCTGGNGAAFRARHGIDADAVVIGHLANKSWDKGTNDLLDACEQLWGSQLDFVLVLAGAEMPTFVERWRRVRETRRILNFGMISDEERRDFFDAIDIFALPSYVESFGVSNLEAALNHKPVVAYAHGGPSQLFADGENARLTPVGQVGSLINVLSGLLADPAERTRIGEAGARVAQRYSWGRVFEILAAEYAVLLGSRG